MTARCRETLYLLEIGLVGQQLDNAVRSSGKEIQARLVVVERNRIPRKVFADIVVLQTRHGKTTSISIRRNFSGGERDWGEEWSGRRLGGRRINDLREKSLILRVSQVTHAPKGQQRGNVRCRNPTYLLKFENESVEEELQGLVCKVDAELLETVALKHLWKQTNNHTKKPTKTGRQTQTDRQTDRQTNQQTDRQTNRQVDRQTNRQTDKPTNRQADKQTNRYTGRRKDRQGWNMVWSTVRGHNSFAQRPLNAIIWVRLFKAWWA